MDGFTTVCLPILQWFYKHNYSNSNVCLYQRLLHKSQCLPFLCFLSLQEMLGELFTPIETPEAQNRGFLKGFFGGNAHTFDREELCVLLFFLLV